MWSRLLSRLKKMMFRGYHDPRRRRAVLDAFTSKYPGREFTSIWLQAAETKRDVVAVFYRERGRHDVPAGLPPYELFAVDATLAVEELRGGLSTPYAVRGVK